MPDRPPTLKGLINRLKFPKAMPRRIAINDLARRSEPEAIKALLAHLEKEDDPKARLLIIRHLGEKRYAPAALILASIRDDEGSPVDIAHAATIACNRIGASEE